MPNMTEVLDTLSANLRSLRHSRGLSQRALADKSGVAFPALARLESGRQSPTLRTIVLLADALCVPVSDLLR